MKQFFKFMFASMLGVFLSAILMMLLCFGIIAAIISSASADKVINLTDGSILHIKFKSPIQDRSPSNPFEDFDFTSMEASSQPGLNDILKNIKKAAADDKIEGIYLDLSELQGGMAVIEEIRDALIEFKESKKFILAYSDFYTQGSYYLATSADEIWMNPEGVVEFRGIAATLPFLKGMFEKLEVEPQVVRHGKFKSAIEPFIYDKMSAENREQVARYVDSFWNQFVNEIAFTRKIAADSLHQIADIMAVQSADDALRYRLVDKLAYMDEFIFLLKEKSGKKQEEDLKLISLKRYTKAADPGPAKEFTRDKIAVIYASGNIVGGKGRKNEIGSESLSETIRKAREDEKVKAVVLRVNSPGGDALASEVIWREVELCKKVKPVIVSMGNLAASGGYYISCAADMIVAEPNTITGSIGVFGLLFNAQNMFKNKLGITFDSYSTGTYSQLGTPTRPITEAERIILQNAVERVYATFTKRVADGRNMSVANVDSIGQGRVWSGIDALAIGLVDTLGGMEDAIEIAARRASLDNYRVADLPERKDPFQQIISELEGDVETRYLRYRLGENFEYINAASNLLQLKGVQARMMFDVVNY